jgi:hypothetical protein
MKAISYQKKTGIRGNLFVACVLVYCLIFFIYILFKHYVASDEIWICYNDQNITFKRTWLDDGDVSNVADLIEQIKHRLRKSTKDVSDKVVTLRHGESEVLSSETPIDGLYNTKEEALHVVVGKHNIQLNLL